MSQSKSCATPVETRLPFANTQNRTVGSSDWMFRSLMTPMSLLQAKVSVHYCPLLFRSEAQAQDPPNVVLLCFCLFVVCVGCWHLSMCDYMSSILTPCQNHWEGSDGSVASFSWLFVWPATLLLSCSLFFEASNVWGFHSGIVCFVPITHQYFTTYQIPPNICLTTVL